jgi:hypothetical protein
MRTADQQKGASCRTGTQTFDMQRYLILVSRTEPIGSEKHHPRLE